MVAPRIIVTAHDGTALGDIDPTKLMGVTVTSEVNGENCMTLTTTQELAKGDRLLWRDGMSTWHEYVIESDETTHETTAAPIHVYYAPWSIQHDLAATFVTGMPGTGGTPASARDALTAALAGTARWAVGTVGISTTGSASFWRLSGWEAMQELVKVWGGEVRATITVSPTAGVTARSVDLLAHIGSQTAVRRYDYGADAAEMSRTVLDDQWTASVMPLGAAEETDTGGYGRKITIESVNGGSAILTNADAVPLTRVPDGNGGWEVPVQIVENSDAETPAALLAWAQAHLDEWTTPRVSYEATVAQLERAGMSAHGVTVGDEVVVVDRTFTEGGLRISGRLLRMDEDLLDPTQTELTISNLRSTLADQLTSIARATQEVYGMVEGMSSSQESQEWVQNLLDRINADINATGGYTYITEGQGIRTYDVAVTDPLVGTEASAVCEIKGGTIRIANNKTAQGEWEWKTVFSSGRILAELIDAIGSSSGYHARLTVDGLDIYDGATLLAHFGATTRIGKTDGSHIELDGSSVSLYGWDTTDEVSRLAASIRVQHIIGQAAGGVIETDVVSASNVYTDGVSIFDTGIHVGRSGERLISSINHGHVEAVTNSNGITTFNPGLWTGDPAQSVTPTWVQVTHVKAASETEAVAKIAVPMVWSIDSPTQVQVRWQRIDTGAWLASNRVGFDWVAIYSA